MVTHCMPCLLNTVPPSESKTSKAGFNDHYLLWVPIFLVVENTFNLIQPLDKSICIRFSNEQLNIMRLFRNSFGQCFNIILFILSTQLWSQFFFRV
ncbi:hypothetical protein GIB67_019924 [Kingdonia uniflora]|uniref:Uncharacterized protein n=1 Tax=Kingdonia uniflora TaxID=39325 RepID=A0A7J7MKY4_9MAGN|nr:hypothetical protein GIB67_019924 [Kingdonia uniflora]